MCAKPKTISEDSRNKSTKRRSVTFCRSVPKAKKRKKCLLVSKDNFSAWPNAIFLHRTTTNNVIDFRKQYFAQYGVRRKIRTGPGTVFVSKAFVQFCRPFSIGHVNCPVRDHKRN